MTRLKQCSFRFSVALGFMKNVIFIDWLTRSCKLYLRNYRATAATGTECFCYSRRSGARDAVPPIPRPYRLAQSHSTLPAGTGWVFAVGPRRPGRAPPDLHCCRLVSAEATGSGSPPPIRMPVGVFDLYAPSPPPAEDRRGHELHNPLYVRASGHRVSISYSVARFQTARGIMEVEKLVDARRAELEPGEKGVAYCRRLARQLGCHYCHGEHFTLLGISRCMNTSVLPQGMWES